MTLEDKNSYTLLSRYIKIVSAEYDYDVMIAWTEDRRMFVIPENELKVTNKGLKSILVKIKWAEEYLKGAICE
jgi:hypothetical protein